MKCSVLRLALTSNPHGGSVTSPPACTKPGEIGALMRRHAAYSSTLATRRRQYAAGKLNGTESKSVVPKLPPWTRHSSAAQVTWRVY